ncbi:hypothetical protein ABZ990_20140 [Streptomyces sp. NPDC046203]|uniref:hypothetical protein n=1 Tax=Streptomyces sp. NPDC046203 TaxID=3154602 RepID=UPI003406DF32
MEMFGFELVRRGYDRDQVDQYISELCATKSPAAPPVFRITWRRGYDRGQVDECIEELRARFGA